jgi:hypothetical protein
MISAIIGTDTPFAETSEFSLTFNTAGSFSYICVLHVDQGMAGVVNVGGATGGGGGTITPPSTGDGGLLDHSSGTWMMLAGVAMLVASLAAGSLMAVRSR